MTLQDKNGGLFSGEFCELFPNEINPCKILHDCVECQAFGTGIHAEGKPDKSKKSYIYLTKKIAFYGFN